MNEIRLPKESSARQSCRRRRNYIEGRQSIYVFFSFLTLTFLFRCHFGVSMLASSSLGRRLLLLAAFCLIIIRATTRRRVPLIGKF